MSERPFLPYGCQSISEEDIEAVIQVLRGAWLTTGPTVKAFEEALCATTQASHAVAIANGTAALHAAYAATGLGPGDEVIVPAMTFCATANAARYLGADVRLADIDETLTMDPNHVEQLLSPRTKLIVPVDYTGHPADLDKLRVLADHSGAHLIVDGAHSLGATYRGKKVGSLADMTTFSFHPVKAITTGEGGAVVTSNPSFAKRVKAFRTHGLAYGKLASDPEAGSWAYDLPQLGFNYRLSDLQCALGVTQLQRLEKWIAKRQLVAAMYDERFAEETEVQTSTTADWCTSHARHLYVIRIPAKKRKRVFEAMRSKKIGVQVHYIPINMLDAYQKEGFRPQDTPKTLQAYQELLSLPCFPGMTEDDIDYVVSTIHSLLRK